MREFGNVGQIGRVIGNVTDGFSRSVTERIHELPPLREVSREGRDSAFPRFMSASYLDVAFTYRDRDSGVLVPTLRCFREYLH
jgi:hypothetical protein